MATREQLIKALKEADAAGNTEDAQHIADQINAGNFDTPGTPRSQQEVFEEWEQRPWYGKVGQSFDDAARLVASGLTAGYSDNMAGTLNEWTGMDEGGVPAEKARTAEAKMRMGGMALPYELMGMLLPASKMSSAARMLPGAGGTGMASSALREGVAGGAMAGLNASSDVAAGTGDVGDIAEAVPLGVLAGAAGGAAGSKAGDVLNWAGKKLGIGAGSVVDDVVPPMSVDDLTAKTDEAYKAVDDLGTTYPLDDYADMVRGMSKELFDEGIDFDLHPKAAAMLNRLQKHASAGGDISPREIDNMRRIISRDVKGSGGENHMAGIMKRYLDDFIATGPVTRTSTDSAAVADKTLRSARDLSRRKNLLADVDEALFKGDNAASDRGDVNALRSLLNNKKKRNQMSKEELEALMQVVRGNTVENAVSRVADVGNGAVTPIGAGFLAGGATGNPMIGVGAGAAMAGADQVGKMMTRRATDRAVGNLKDVIAGGSTTPAMSRQVIPSAGQALSVLAIDEDLEKKRRKKR